MSTRRAKQIIYGALYAVVVLIVCAGIYFVSVAPAIVASTPPVCTPSSCVPTSTAPIVPGALTTFITSPGHYTFLAQVTNQSADYGAPELDYAIDLDDASGTVLQAIPAQAFIYPSQTRYLAVLNQVVAQPFDHATLVVTGASWLASSTIGVIPSVGPGQFAIQNVQEGHGLDHGLRRRAAHQYERCDIWNGGGHGDIHGPERRPCRRLGRHSSATLPPERRKIFR